MFKLKIELEILVKLENTRIIFFFLLQSFRVRDGFSVQELEDLRVQKALIKVITLATLQRH
jgi:hypothetical protein